MWLEGSGSPIHDDNGDILGAVTVLRDITTRKAMEEKLPARPGRGRERHRGRQERIPGQYEPRQIRTPLTAIRIGFGGLLERVKDLPPNAEKRSSARITTASQTLLSVVNEVLDFSKIEAGQIVLDPQPFDPAAFVAETLGLVEGQASGKRLTLESDIGEEVPSAVNADSSRVRQVLLNLLGNAIKFTHHGSICVGLSYSAAGGGQLHFRGDRQRGRHLRGIGWARCSSGSLRWTAQPPGNMAEPAWDWRSARV